MADPKKLTVTMKKNKTCKSCVRFGTEGKDAEDVGSSFYLQNTAFEKLGKPGEIKLTVEAAK
ncbi:MAG: hypothetical protein FVQ80_11375 [Planctomycetes bacterium]|nr:hypothetical protein [Planctomycetota bacterium]